MAKISVIITSYNQKDILARAVESVAVQTLRPSEIIICDDCSRDGSQEYIKALENKWPGWVRGVLQQTNQGISRNRNAGLSVVQGDHVTWLDGDDLFQPNKLAQEWEALRESGEARWAYSQVTTCFEKENKVFPRYVDPPSGWIFEKILYLLGRAPRNPTVEMAALKKIGFFNPLMTMYEDFDLLTRLARNFPCTYCAEPGMIYMVHDQGTHQAQAEKHFANLQLLENNVAQLIGDQPPALLSTFPKNLELFKRKIRGRSCLTTMARCSEEGDRLGATRNLVQAWINNSELFSLRNFLRQLVRIISH